MLRELTLVDGHCHRNPNAYGPSHRLIHGGLFCERAQDVAIVPHDLLGKIHLPFELGIVRRNPEPVRRLAQENAIPELGPQLAQHFFRKDDANRIAKFRKLERLVHTLVITRKVWLAEFKCIRFEDNVTLDGKALGT